MAQAPKPAGSGDHEHIWEDKLFALIHDRCGRPSVMTPAHEMRVLEAERAIREESLATPDSEKKSEPPKEGEVQKVPLLTMEEVRFWDDAKNTIFNYHKRTRLIERIIKVRRKMKAGTSIEMIEQYQKEQRILRRVYSVGGDHMRLYVVHPNDARVLVGQGELQLLIDRNVARQKAVFEICDKYNDPTLTFGEQFETAWAPHFDTKSTNEEEPEDDDRLIAKPDRPRSEVHLRYVRGLSCCVCGRPGGFAHHVRIGHNMGGKRPGDDRAVPLCFAHHDPRSGESLHFDGNEARWWAGHGIDPLALAAALWAARTAGREALF